MFQRYRLWQGVPHWDKFERWQEFVFFRNTFHGWWYSVDAHGTNDNLQTLWLKCQSCHYSIFVFFICHWLFQPQHGYILTILHSCLGDCLGHQSCGIPNREYLTPNQLPVRYVKPNCWYGILQTCGQMVQWFHLIKPLLVIALENKMNCYRAMLQKRVNTFGSTTNHCCYCKEMGFLLHRLWFPLLYCMKMLIWWKY